MIDFLGIGPSKTGTSWLYRHLHHHPQIRFPAGKEVHFWSAYRPCEQLSLEDELLRRQRLRRLGADPDQLKVDWWLGLFPDRPRFRQGEISPPYSLLDAATIREIAALLPDLRLFYSLRNPIARAWSQTRHQMRRSGMTLADASDAWLQAKLDRARERSDYLAAISRWGEVFGDRLRIIVLDDIIARPAEVIAELYRHLGVVPRFIQPPHLVEPAYVGLDYDLPPHFLPALRDTYQPMINVLSCWLGRDLSGWLAWDGTRASEKEIADVAGCHDRPSLRRQFVGDGPQMDRRNQG